jgi:shikimate kinase
VIAELKRTPGLYVVGFMAAGKTTIGRLLAEELGWKFADLDDDIVARAGKSIPEIFDTLGEPAFREIEHLALKARVRLIQRGQPHVIALGGGAFAHPRNQSLLAENGVSVWLDCPLELVERRVAFGADRPLAADPESFRTLYAARRDAYVRADHRIEIASDDPKVAVAAILKLPIF